MLLFPETFTRNSYFVRRLAPLLLSAAAALPAAGLDVWVDFTTDFHDGNDSGAGNPNGIADWIDELNQATQRANLSNNDETSSNTFTTAQREQIQDNILSELRRVYDGTLVNFVTERPDGLHDVLYFGQDNAIVGGSFGSAQGDFGNVNTLTYTTNNLNNPTGNPASVPKVAPANFNSAIEPTFDTIDEIITELSNSLAGTAAHELGHSLGLFHHFAYSAEGITPDNLNDTGGLQNRHIIATGSTGLNERERENIDRDRTLSPFSKVVFDVAGGLSSFQGAFSRENTPIVANAISSDDSELRNGDAGNTLATAQALTFDTGTLSGSEISFIEADLDGGSNDVDLFRFDIAVEANFSAHVFSERLFLFNEFDPTLALLDADGNQIAFSDDVIWSGDRIQIDEAVPGDTNADFEDDAFLFNILLAAGTYYIEVAATDVEISDIPNAGDQYALLTSLVLIPEPTSAALLAAAFGGVALRRRRTV